MGSYWLNTAAPSHVIGQAPAPAPSASLLNTCGDEYPMPEGHVSYRCTLFDGHSGLHCYQQPGTDPALSPPLLRWWRCTNGEVIPRDPWIRSRLVSAPQQLNNITWKPSTL